MTCHSDTTGNWTKLFDFQCSFNINSAFHPPKAAPHNNGSGVSGAWYGPQVAVSVPPLTVLANQLVLALSLVALSEAKLSPSSLFQSIPLFDCALTALRSLQFDSDDRRPIVGSGITLLLVSFRLGSTSFKDLADIAGLVSDGTSSRKDMFYDSELRNSDSLIHFTLGISDGLEHCPLPLGVEVCMISGLARRLLQNAKSLSNNTPPCF